MYFLSNEEIEQWIKDYVERESTVARKRVQDAETAIMQKQEDMSTAENAGVTPRKPKKMFEEMLNAIEDSWSDYASSNDEHDGEDQEDDEEDTELGKLSGDDEPRSVMGRISKSLQHLMDCFWQKQMRLDESMQPGWGYAANSFCGRDI